MPTKEPQRVAIFIKPQTRTKLIARISKEQEDGKRISYDTFINRLLQDPNHNQS